MPAWSPNGKQVAVTRGFGGELNGPAKFTEIFVLNAAGGGLRQLTRVTSSSPYSANVDHPVWAPDGQRLVFEAHNSANGEPAGRRALFVIKLKGVSWRCSEPLALTPTGLPTGRQSSSAPSPERSSSATSTHSTSMEAASSSSLGPGTQGRPSRLLLPRRQVDHLLQVHLRCSGRLHHAPERQRSPPGQQMHLRCRGRLGAYPLSDKVARSRDTWV